MPPEDWLSTAEVKAVFAEEIAGAGGKVRDVFEDGRRLFARAVLPGTLEVRPGDRIQGGVALRVTDFDVYVHPYTFRQVCTNGAIRAHAVETRQITYHDAPVTAEAVSLLREAIRNCCDPQVFAAGVGEMRDAAQEPMDRVLDLMPMLARMQKRHPEVAVRLLARFLEEKEPTRFGWMNAVTAEAREAPDPEVRWRLEEYGGGIAAGLLDPDLLLLPGNSRRLPVTPPEMPSAPRLRDDSRERVLQTA